MKIQLENKNRDLSLFAGAVGAVLALVASPSFAQQDRMMEEHKAVGIEEIIVTARKKEERLLDIPSSVTALTQDRLQDLGIRGIDDVARFTPGLSFSKAFGRSTDRPVIRGGANILVGTAPLAESGAAYYVNGVYFQGDIQSLDMNQVERVEVLKGPQSSAYGRNAYAGAVNFVLKDLVGGELNVDVKAEGGIGGKGQDREEFSATARMPVGDHWGFMVGWRHWAYDGEYQNRTTGQTIGDERTRALNLGVQFNAGNHDFKAYFTDTRDRDGTRALQLQRSDLNNCYPGFRSNLIKTTAVDAVRHGTEAGARNADNPFQYYCGDVRPLPYVRLNDGSTVDPAPPAGTDPTVNPNAYDATTPFSGVNRDRQITTLQYAFENDHATVNANFSIRDETRTSGADSDHWDLRFYSSDLGSPPEDANFPTRRAFFNFASAERFDDTSFELRITSNQDQALRWSIGYFYYDWKNQTEAIDWRYDVNSIARTTVIRDDPTTDESTARPCGGGVTNDCTAMVTDAPNSVAYLGVGSGLDVDEYGIKNNAFFGSIEYEFGKSTVGFEARTANEKKSLRDTTLVNGLINATPGVVGTPTTMAEMDGAMMPTGIMLVTQTDIHTQADRALSVSKDDDRSFNSLTWKLFYSLQLADNTLLYASLSTGNKPGGVNNALAEEAGYPDFEEEESTNVEIGFKTTFANNRIYMAGSLFRNEIKKFQLTTPLSDPTGALASAVSNQGDAEVIGLEYEARVFLSERFDVGFSGAVIDPKITQGCDPFQYVLTSGGYNYDADRTTAEATALGVRAGATCDISDNQIPLTSKVQLSADFNANFPLGTLMLTAGVNGNLESTKYAQVHNGLGTGEAVELGAYVALSGERWSVRLTGRNITNENAPVALTRWADYGQGSSCYFNPAGFCSGVASDEFEAGQQAHIQGLGSQDGGVTDTGSPRAVLVSLRQQASWVLTASYRF